MPKRSYEEKMERYNYKIRKLEEKQHRKRQRIIYSSDSDENSDNEQLLIDEPAPTVTLQESVMLEGSGKVQENVNSTQEPVPVPELDPDILLALGEETEDAPKFGENIHNNLARLWMPILRKGLEKEAKEKLKKQFLIPENCSLLQAPKLNPEIAAAISDVTKYKDKSIENVQQQLGLGITALNRGLSLLLDNDKDKVKAIKFLSDSCRILCDLHYVETAARKKIATPHLDKSFSILIQEVERDDTLFGQKLSEKIKASKAIEKQSIHIKKSAPVHKTPTAPAQASTSKPRSQVNWSGPPRYTSSNRGGRGGYKKTAPAGRRGPHPQAQTAAKHSPQTFNKPRAPAQN